MPGLLEKYITSASTADEFLSFVSGKNSQRPPADGDSKMRPQDFTKVKQCVEAG